MSASLIWPVVTGRRWPFRARGLKAFVLPAIVLLLCTSLLVALEVPSKPFLEKNSFLLSSAGFRVKLANDAAGQKALRALLYGDPYDWDNLNQPDSLAEYLRDYY